MGAAAVALVFGFHFTHAATPEPATVEPLDVLAQEATSNDADRAAAAIAQLRAAGPAGLETMFRVYSERIKQQQSGALLKDAGWERLRVALDVVGEQRDCYASHLYWYTNLDRAKAAARTSGKPILSLRLLGKLNEEYSCANSRFFRTTLYPNAEVSQYLREHFILLWQSVRPVPRITIDMGDGRRIERTITGNSIHYVLDAEGNPIDALPGLYGAKAFLAKLGCAVAAEQQASHLKGAEREAFLKSYHSTQLAEIQREWSSDLEKITGAQDASVLSRDRLDAMSTDTVWQRIAALHSDEAALDPATVRLIEHKQSPTASQAALVAISKTRIENPMVRILRNLQRSVAEDSVRNEYQLHWQIHEWFVNGAAPANLAALNSKVYAELFLTPISDPWLGLAPTDVFSALDRGGLVQNKGY